MTHTAVSRFNFLVKLVIFSLAALTSAMALANTTTPEKPTFEERLKAAEYDDIVANIETYPGYLQDLIKQARERQLHTLPTWETLIHYKYRWLIGLESQVDSDEFFLSNNGKYNPQAELLATLAAFYSELPVKPSKYSPQCRFPARYFWLKQQLQFDPQKLPEQHCPDLEKYKEVVDPESLTVVFPSSHPNSPSSMFGHTLLRINKKNQTEDTRMLAFSINYAAQIDPEQDMLSYTVLGLSGGFFGKFMLLPYYVKLREYAQMENRDLWEYDLKIPRDKMDFILLHTFELSYSYFDYYFFTENCSYHLLSLLDVAYPDNPMTDTFSGWTIPVDTLKLLQQRGLIAEGRFYPSLVRKINHRRKQIAPSLQQLVLQASQSGIDSISDPLEKLDTDNQIYLLDLLSDYQKFNKIEKSKKKVSSKLSAIERKTLLYRSKLKQKSLPLNVPAPGVSPDRGHDTARWTLGKIKLDESYYTDLEWRPAYHDPLDNSAGFVSNSGLSFMRTRMRHLHNKDKWQFQELEILNVQSLKPYDNYFTDLSWHAQVRWNKQALPENNWMNISSFNGGQGYAVNLKEYKTSLYGFVDATVLYAQTLDSNYSLQPGLHLGLLSEPVPGWRLRLTAKYNKGILGDNLANNNISFEQGFRISNTVNLLFSATRQRFAEYRYTRTELAARVYF